MWRIIETATRIITTSQHATQIPFRQKACKMSKTHINTKTHTRVHTLNFNQT